MFIITDDSPKEDILAFVSKKHESYRTYGAVGDEVYVQTLFGDWMGRVVELKGNHRKVLSPSGGTLAYQTWAQDCAWLDGCAVNLKAVVKKE